MDKWIAISITVFLVAMFGSLAIESYQKNQCRIAATKAGKSAEDIVKICR